MATPPSDVVKQSDFLNRLVLDQETMQEQGRVEVLWMYPQANRVLGFICKSGFLGARKTAFNLSQIQAMGDNTLLTQGEPDKTDATRVQKLESLIHFEVWTDAGERIGRITDCLFKLRSGVITRYLMVSDPWGGLANGVYLISPKTIKGFGNGRVLMSQEAVKTLNVYSEGIKQRLEEFREFLEDEYDQITYRLRSLIGRARSTTQRVHNRIEQLGDQTKEGVQTFSEDAKTKAVGFRERLRERTQSWIDQAQATGQQWTEQVKEQTQTLGENWSDRPQPDSAPTLNVDAEEIPASIFDDDDDAFDFPDETTAQSSTRKLDPATEPSNDTWKDMPAAATWTDAQDVDWTDDDDDSWLTEDVWCDDEEHVSHSRSGAEIATSPIAAPDAEVSTSTSSAAAETIIVPPAASPPASVATPTLDWDDEWEDTSQPEPEREQSSTSPPSPNQPESPASSTPSSAVPNWVDDDDDDPWI